jgi:cytochrome c5
MKKAIVASAVVGAFFMASGQAMAADGKGVYDQACFACHKTGAAGAPKVGDKAAWAPRISQGMDVLNEHAINGFKGNSGFMPAKGGYSHLSDEEVAAAIEYMTSNSK